MMNFILSLVFGIALIQPSLENKILDQSVVYIEGISNQINITENFWALNELYQSSCEINNSVIRVIINSDNNQLKNYFTKIPCGSSENEKIQNSLARLKKISIDNKLLGLGVYYILNQPDVPKQKLFIQEFEKETNDDASLLNLIFNQKQFSLNEIPEDEKDFIFHSIIYSEVGIATYLNNESIIFLANQWTKDFKNKKPSLTSSIHTANIIKLLFELNRYKTIEEILSQTLSDNLFPNSFTKTRYLNAVSYSLFIIGRYDESLKVLRNHLIPLYDFLQLEEDKEVQVFTMGVNLYSLGKFEEAKQTFESIYFDPNSKIPKYELFNNLSICYFKLGEKNKYLDLQLNALEEANQGTEYKERLIILRNLFIYYTSIKDSETALLYLNRAEQIALENKDNYELAAIHAFSGTFYWDNYKDAEKALNELSIAQKEFDPSKDFADFVNVLKEEAEILISINSLDRARVKFEELKQLSIQSSNTPNYLESLIGLTEIELLENDLDDAARLIEEIKIYPLDDIDFELLVKYNTVKSSLLFNSGYKRDAYQELIPVIEQVIERAKTSIDSQTGFWSIEPEYIDAFNTIISMLIDLNDESKALQLLDELKTINDVALYNSPILRAKKLTEEDLAQDQLLNKQIIDLRTEYLNSSSNDKFSIKADIDRLSAQREQILNKIRTDVNDDPISTWSLQKKLSNYEMVLHFTEIGEQLYVSYITRDIIKIEVINFDASIKRLFEDTANNLASSDTDLNQLYEIYNVLGIENNIPKTIESLTVIPDNYLFRLPLDILPTKLPESNTSYGSTHYLIEDFDVRYYTSINNFLTNSRKITKDYELDFSAFALSDFSSFKDRNLQSLPFATKEVRSINSKLENFENKSIFLETDADKYAFLESAKSSKIVHVATHSEVSEQDPLFSTIYLNNSSDEALTSLYAYELFDTQMNSELIMLNSCSSGSGSYLQGSGIMGISRALRYAGAKSLALNLWSVNDKAASEFATSFYTTINSGSPKWEAMRSAKLSLLEKGNANPYYWGAYMLIGNSSPLTEKPARAGFLYPVLLLTIVWCGYKIRREKL